ncbi:MAG: DUF92 domain-containing protein [Bacteroidota bacterium]
MMSLWELPPEAEWWTLGFILAGITLFLGLGEAVRKHRGWSPEFSRKFIHISVGILAAFTPVLFTVPLLPILLAMLFIGVNGIALKMGLLPGIHSIDRPSYGTVYFPIAFLLLLVFFWYREPMIITLSMLVLALADSGAAIVGESLKKSTQYRLTSDRKSIEGSIAMALVSFVVLLTGLTFSMDMELIPMEYVIACAGVGSVVATACEAISSRGLDNLSIPLSIAFVLSFFLVPQSGADVFQLTMAVSFGIFIGVASFKAGLLTASGAVATFLLAVVVFGIGGWQWTIPLMTFFLLSSIFSRVGAKRKAVLRVAGEKFGGRDYAQVFANGGIGGILALLAYWYPELNIYPVFVGSIAAVTADTWGTELGLLARGRTVRFPDFSSVAPGTNGGITLVGLMAGIGGSLAIAVSASPWLETSLMGWVLIAGLAGSAVDSILGGILQARFRCPVCGTITDERVHCNNQPTALVSGLAWLNNDGVNWVCAFTGALVMRILLIILG